MDPNSAGNKERLQKILSAYGITSRRDAERLILEGRVSVNGITATLGQSALYGVDSISVDGVPLSPADKLVYLMLNKPCGYLTAVSDKHGRKTVMELIRDVDERVYPAGRLDLNSEGLLLFTNDGAFANKITHPSFEKKKTYEVSIRGDVQKAVALLKQPVIIDGYTVRAVSVDLLKTVPNGGVLNITISEGRNRQIRKMCTACGVKVDSLKRVSIGKLMLGDLKSGQWRYLTGEEVKSIG